VEYQLIPQEVSAATAPATVMRSEAATDTLFTLIRRELMDVSSIESIRNPNPSLNASQANSDSERVLTAQDLYRQTDDTRPSRGVALRETRLDGLVRGQFQYFDGVSWRAEWNSEQSGGLPRAIALGFDFPARADMQPRQTSTTSLAIDNASGADEAGGGISSLTTGSMQSFAESALAAEPTVTSSSSSGDSSLMQNATHEVQIVVYVGRQASGSVDQQPFDSRTGGDF
jgi:hypothetical protein